MPHRLSRNDLTVRPGHAGPGLPTPEAQCLGEYVFNYALLPHSGDWLAVNLEHHYQQYVTGLVGLTTDIHHGILPAPISFLRVSPAHVIVSAIKKSTGAQDTYATTLRLYNCSPKPTVARLQLPEPFLRWQEVDLLEQPKSAASGPGQPRQELELGPWEIATARIVFAGPGPRLVGTGS